MSQLLADPVGSLALVVLFSLPLFALFALVGAALMGIWRAWRNSFRVNPEADFTAVTALPELPDHAVLNELRTATHHLDAAQGWLGLDDGEARLPLTASWLAALLFTPTSALRQARDAQDDLLSAGHALLRVASARPDWELPEPSLDGSLDEPLAGLRRRSPLLHFMLSISPFVFWARGFAAFREVQRTLPRVSALHRAARRAWQSASRSHDSEVSLRRAQLTREPHHVRERKGKVELDQARNHLAVAEGALYDASICRSLPPLRPADLWRWVWVGSDRQHFERLLLDAGTAVSAAVHDLERAATRIPTLEVPSADLEAVDLAHPASTWRAEGGPRWWAWNLTPGFLQAFILRQATGQAIAAARVLVDEAQEAVEAALSHEFVAEEAGEPSWTPMPAPRRVRAA